jgi:hypothetical protein
MVKLQAHKGVSPLFRCDAKQDGELGQNLGRQCLDHRPNQFVTLHPVHTFEICINNADANGRRIVAIDIDLGFWMFHTVSVPQCSEYFLGSSVFNCETW